MDFELAFVIGIAGAAVALVFALLQRRRVMKFTPGTDAMRNIARKIRLGAYAYLKRQFRVVAIFYVVAVAILTSIVIFGNDYMSPFIPVSFVLGGLLTQVSSLIGMMVATRANVRTAHASEKSLNEGLRVAFSSGTVLSFTVVGLSLLDVSVWFLVLRFAFGLEARQIADNMVMFGAGVAAFALFARVGGGIFTKAADVGADLVGKIEAGIPEDDPRNPAVIADNVGDNVGDVAGMGADLYESYIKSLHAAIALGFAAFYTNESLMFASMFLPVGLAVVGVIASLIGTFFIRTKESATKKQLLGILRTGTNGAAVIAAIGFGFVTYFVMGSEGNWLGLYIAILSGLGAGCLIAFFTEYYTSTHYKPTRKLAESSETGAGTLVIAGISLGMKSTAAPILIIVVAIVVAYISGGGVFGNYSDASFAHGLYGIGLAAVGMLSTLGITLACDAYGPVADNAGGIAEMAGMDPKVRERTDILDSIGNTTAATGKGFAIGSAALTSLALLVSYIKLAARESGISVSAMNLNIQNPSVLIGIFIGAMLVFAFSAMTMSSVQRAAQSIVIEVRRQFKEIVGLMEGKVESEYEKCIDICTRSALREMVGPTLLGVAVPILTGLVFGVEGVIGLIGGSTVVGFVMAVFMANSGGAWDNAKKYIEAGHYGGKGSENHKAAVIGDTVGDPFKDTTGPSLNTLFKMISTVSMIFVAITVKYSLF